jgi:hypothetical protein
MTRHVYPGEEIAHLYAADCNVYAFNSTRSVTASGGVLYSYSEPIVAWIADRLLMSSDSFSKTTAKHKQWAFRALHHLNPISVPDLKWLVKNNAESSICEYIVRRVSEIADIRKSMERMRAEWKKQDAQNLIARLEAACEIARLGQEFDAAIFSDVESLYENGEPGKEVVQPERQSINPNIRESDTAPAGLSAGGGAEARSKAIREFCDKAGIRPSQEVLGLPDDVRLWRMETAVAARRATERSK